MSYNPNKCDSDLGLRVHQHLDSLGLETPFTNKVHLPETKKILAITKQFKQIMEELGLDLTDDSLNGTPLRVANMFVNEIFWGLYWDKFPKCTTVENKMGYNEMVIERNINVQSTCEHHFITINGIATIAYIPNEYVLGLSKMNRIVEYFSRRPQIQERLTEQIFHTLQFILETENIAVLIDAHHHCVSSRGVEDARSRTTTSRVGGAFKTDPITRSEFMSIARR